MNGKDFSQIVDLVLKDDTRYGKGAYYFVRKALDYTVKDLEGDEQRTSKHVSGAGIIGGNPQICARPVRATYPHRIHRLEYQEVLGFWRYSVLIWSTLGFWGKRSRINERIFCKDTILRTSFYSRLRQAPGVYRLLREK